MIACAPFQFTGLYKEHAEGTDQDPGVEKDIASEYVRQQAHLEKTVKFLKVKATKEKEKKRNETVRLMQVSATATSLNGRIQIMSMTDYWFFRVTWISLIKSTS